MLRVRGLALKSSALRDFSRTPVAGVKDGKARVEFATEAATAQNGHGPFLKWVGERGRHARPRRLAALHPFSFVHLASFDPYRCIGSLQRAPCRMLWW